METAKQVTLVPTSSRTELKTTKLMSSDLPNSYLLLEYVND